MTIKHERISSKQLKAEARATRARARERSARECPGVDGSWLGSILGGGRPAPRGEGTTVVIDGNRVLMGSDEYKAFIEDRRRG